MQLGPVLQSLTAFRERLLFIDGLDSVEALKGMICSSQSGNPLSRAAGLGRRVPLRHQLRPDHRATPWAFHPGDKPGPGLRSVESGNPQERLDAVPLAYLLEFGPRDDTARVISGTGIRPALSDEAGRGDPSVMDARLDEASWMRRKISRKISRGDQRKLEEYLSSAREVETRLEQGGKDDRPRGWRPTLDEPNRQRPPQRIPRNLQEQMKRMCDILGLAFQTDSTCVRAFKLNHDHGHARFARRNVAVGHHEWSHPDRGDQSPDWLKVTPFFFEQLAHTDRKLDAIREGERTVLDNSVVMYLSRVRIARLDASNFARVLVGGGGGQLHGGSVLDFLGQSNPSRPVEPQVVPSRHIADGHSRRYAAWIR